MFGSRSGYGAAQAAKQVSAVVLIVEDEPILGRNMRTFLNARGYRAELAASLTAARDMWANLHPDLIFLDHNLPDGLGLSLIPDIRALDPWTKIVMLTAHGGVNLAVAAMKAGADDYLTKPASLDEIGLTAQRMMEQARKEGAARYINRLDREAAGLDRLVGTSPAMGELRRRIRALHAAEAAGPPPPVLILGETGTGKELVARAIHYGGARSAEPFITVSCATLSDAMVDDQLFGHERGAFPGAEERRLGLIEAAHGGTLFLDEVAALAPAHQARLLKSLEDGRIRMLGAVEDRTVDVRVIAATNAPLPDLVREGKFRADLYYRLAHVTVEVPPLIKRGQDVIQIAETILADLQTRLGRPKLCLSKEAEALLMRHRWPGNVRELRNMLEQAAFLSPRDAIAASDLPIHAVEIESAPESHDVEPGLEAVERTLIISALRTYKGNVTNASASLGISRDTLRYRMEKFGLRREFYTG